MKKNLIILGMAFFLVMAWSARAEAQECEKKKQKSEVTKAQKSDEAYQCPMKCEGDKTYDKPGKCPTCGMELKKVKTATAQSTKACEKQKGDKSVAAVYQCPMKCEGDKTYDKPGKCPKCGMDLKKTETQKKVPSPNNEE